MAEFYNLLLSIIGVIFLGILFVIIISPKHIYRYFNIFHFPKVSVPAKIVDRKVYFKDEQHTEHILIFQLYTGKRLNFKVDSETYSLYYAGDKGLLVYRGEKFISFDKRF